MFKLKGLFSVSKIHTGAILVCWLLISLQKHTLLKWISKFEHYSLNFSLLLVIFNNMLKAKDFC